LIKKEFLRQEETLLVMISRLRIVLKAISNTYLELKVIFQLLTNEQSISSKISVFVTAVMAFYY